MAKAKLTKRDIWMLRYLLDFNIHRYMICNSKGREDGSEKVSVHIEISTRLAMFFLCEGIERNKDSYNIRNVKMKIHNYLADILTDNMDKVIGYPIDKPIIGDEFSLYADKFFNVIIEHTKEIEEICLTNKRQH